MKIFGQETQAHRFLTNLVHSKIIESIKKIEFKPQHVLFLNMPDAPDRLKKIFPYSKIQALQWQELDNHYLSDNFQPVDLLTADFTFEDELDKILARIQLVLNTYGIFVFAVLDQSAKLFFEKYFRKNILDDLQVMAMLHSFESLFVANYQVPLVQHFNTKETIHIHIFIIGQEELPILNLEMESDTAVNDTVYVDNTEKVADSLVTTEILSEHDEDLETNEKINVIDDEKISEINHYENSDTHENTAEEWVLENENSFYEESIHAEEKNEGEVLENFIENEIDSSPEFKNEEESIAENDKTELADEIQELNENDETDNEVDDENDEEGDDEIDNDADDDGGDEEEDEDEESEADSDEEGEAEPDENEPVEKIELHIDTNQSDDTPSEDKTFQLQEVISLKEFSLLRKKEDEPLNQIQDVKKFNP